MGYYRLVRPGLLATAAGLVIMVALSVWAYAELPERVPIHWNVAGDADRLGSRIEAVVVLPLVALGSSALLAVVPLLDPRRANLERSAKAYQAVWIGVMVLVTVMHGAVLASAVADGIEVSVPRIALVLTGGLLMVVGNYLGKIRSNWFAGVRTPWTLSSERSWAKTHRLGGRLLTLVGAATVVAALVASVPVALGVQLGGLLVITVVLTAYSYLVWRSDPERSTLGAGSA
jgi:uncharacterized membrane protein